MENNDRTLHVNGMELTVPQEATEEEILNEIADMFPGTARQNLQVVNNPDGSVSVDMKAGTKG